MSRRVAARRLLRSAWHLFLFCADHLVFLVPPHRVAEPDELLIIKPDKLGDFIVWLDAAREYPACFPHMRSVLVADAAWSTLAETLGLWDQVVALDGSRFREHLGYRLRMLHRIRRAPTAVAINASVRRSFRVSDALVRFSTASETIGMTGRETREGRTWIQRWSDRWYSRLIVAEHEVSEGELARQMSFVHAMGGTPRRAALPRVDWDGNAPVPERCPAKGYVVLILGAATTSRRWPIRAFVETATRVLRETDQVIVLCGTRAEQVLAHAFLAAFGRGDQARIVDLTGATDIVELGGVLAKAGVVLGNETGAVHLAAALGRPTVCVAGGGDFSHLVPYPDDLDTGARPVPVTVYERLPCYGCGWRCIHEVAEGDPAPCISAVSVEAVWERLHPLVKAADADELPGNRFPA